MKRYIRMFGMLLVCILIFNSMVFADLGIEDEVSAFLLGDYEKGEVLEGYNIYEPMEVASISKIMSYIIVMDHIKSNLISLEDKICIDQDTAEVKGSSLKLEAGETFTVEELLKAVIVVSANDATYGLAKHVAGSEEAFVRMMNDRARDLGLSHSIYINATGLPEGEMQNMMSPEDIFQISRYVIRRHPEILSMGTIPYIEVPDRGYREENTNPLLNKIEGIDGLKTGFTNKAGHCLVSTLMLQASDENGGFRLIGIVMGTETEDKRGELGGKLIQYGMNNYSKKTITQKAIAVDTIYIPKGRDKEIKVYPSRDFSKVVKSGSKIDQDILINERLRLPLKKGSKVGKLVISEDGYILEEIDLIVGKDVKKEGLFRWIVRNLRELLSRVF